MAGDGLEGPGLCSSSASAWPHTRAPPHLQTGRRGECRGGPPQAPESLSPSRCRDLRACRLRPGHIRTHLAPPLEGVPKPPPISTTPTKGPLSGALAALPRSLSKGRAPRPVLKNGAPSLGFPQRPGPGTSDPGAENDILQRENQCSLREWPSRCLTSPPVLPPLEGPTATLPWSTGPLPTPHPHLPPKCGPASASPPLPSSRRQTGIAGKKLGETG